MTSKTTLGWLQNYCASQLLAEKWLLCDDLRTSQTWKDRIVLAGTPTLNLHAHSLRSAVLSLVSLTLAERGLTFLASAAARGLLLDLLQARWRTAELRYFREERYADSLAALIERSFRDLRLADVAAEDLISDAFYAPEKGADLRLLYEDYTNALESQRLVDYAACVEQAIAGLTSGEIATPPSLLVLLPEAGTRTQLEQRFLDVLASRGTVLCCDQDSPFDAESVRTVITQAVRDTSARFEYFAGHGEVNEVRGVVQRILRNNQRLDDFEIIHTDSGTYVPLIYEFFASAMARRTYANSDETGTPKTPEEGVASAFDPTDLPVTFAEGIACVYARPGRALRAWMRWANAGFVQSKLVQMIREGLLVRPATAETIGYARLAANLRRVPIGFQRDRYLPALEEAIIEADRRQQDYLQDAQREPAEAQDVPRDFGLPVLRALQEMLRPVIELSSTTHTEAPAEPTSETLLLNAKRFLLSCARCDHKLDRIARNKLLDEIDGRLAALDYAEQNAASTRQWLEDLPVECVILDGGPKPGCVHVNNMERGGTTGRRSLFVVGLDAGRFPKRRSVDPFLLDDERTRISAGLPTSVQLAEERQSGLLRAMRRALQVPAVEISLSFATRNLMEDRSLEPSASLVELFRVSEGLAEAHQDDVLRHVTPVVSFASTAADDWLAPDDRFLAGLLTMDDSEEARQQLSRNWEYFAEQSRGAEQRASEQFTEFDGLVAAAGEELCPADAASDSRAVSPSRLETYGKCPRRFFFRYGLGIYLPDEYDVDQESWLDALQTGSLLHDVFETFLRQLTEQNLRPNFKRDWPAFQDVLHQRIDEQRLRYPIPNEDTYARERDRLEETCEIFLQQEQVYCEATGAVPWVLEGAIGVAGKDRSPIDSVEPVTLTLGDGRRLRVAGQIDRIDICKTNGAESYAIWDYKTGSSFGYDAGDPFVQGRKLQPYLYVHMLRHRLSELGKDKEAALSFGFFFPSAKEAGRRINWTRGELRRGDEIVGHLCDLLAAGAFPATTKADDCKFCEYLSVCGDPAEIAAQSFSKSSNASNLPILKPWTILRGIVG